MIGNVRRKPGALRNLVYREALFPDHADRRAWQAFDAQLDVRQACRDAVALLDIAARGDCVDVLPRRIDEALDSGRLPDVHALRDEFLPTAHSQPDVALLPPDLNTYNRLTARARVHR